MSGTFTLPSLDLVYFSVGPFFQSTVRVLPSAAGLRVPMVRVVSLSVHLTAAMVIPAISWTLPRQAALCPLLKATVPLLITRISGLLFAPAFQAPSTEPAPPGWSAPPGVDGAACGVLLGLLSLPLSPLLPQPLSSIAAMAAAPAICAALRTYVSSVVGQGHVRLAAVRDGSRTAATPVRTWCGAVT